MKLSNTGQGACVSAAYWLTPPLLCLLVYWLGLKAWFQADDFAWLQLRQDVHSWGELWRAVFAPMAQGTIRPWSERVFFMAFSAVFGLDALPFRVWVFLTQFANLALVSAITRRVSGSRVAGFWAPILWTANGALATAMSWTSAYNQILCCFFVLTSFYLLLRHVETGRLRYYVAQWVTFLLGFGALEINVVYPALAAGYTLACARRYLWRTLPMLVPSVAFVWVHNWVAPKVASGAYGMHFDASVLGTLWTYWEWALGPARLDLVGRFPFWVGPAGTLLLTAGILAFVGWKVRQRRWLAAFLLAWFAIVLAPVLPLRDHVSDYYLTLPTVGLAILGGWACGCVWGSSWRWKVAAVALAGLYLASSVPAARTTTRWRYDRGRAVRALVLGVWRAHQLHPGKVILLEGVDSDLFWSGVFDRPFRLFGAREVYLTPGSESRIEPHPELGELAGHVLPGRIAQQALAQSRAVVYSVGGGRLRNITQIYQLVAGSQGEAEEPRQVNVGAPLFAGQLGSGWYDVEGADRWMAKRATLRLGGPRTSSDRLYVSGYALPPADGKGPLRLTVAVDGRALPAASLADSGGRFSLEFPLPAEAIGKPSIEVSVEVDRTVTHSGDPRQLGMIFGTFAVR
jgi:hypothetical protein